MKIKDNIDTGLISKETTLSVQELQRIRTLTIDAREHAQKKFNKNLAAEKLFTFLMKLTDGISSEQELDKALFEEEKGAEDEK